MHPVSLDNLTRPVRAKLNLGVAVRGVLGSCRLVGCSLYSGHRFTAKNTLILGEFASLLSIGN